MRSDVSNRLSMKTVSQRVSNNLEFLRALAQVYEHEKNEVAKEATINAIAALCRLKEIIDHPNGEVPQQLTEAA